MRYYIDYWKHNKTQGVILLIALAGAITAIIFG
jgi:hypothetical protein